MPQHDFYPFHSKALHQFALLYPLLYDRDGTRRLRVEVLDAMGPEGLAWWLGDDGFRQKKRRGRQDTLCLALCRYPREDQRRAQRWFAEKYGKAHLDKVGVLRFNVPATKNIVRACAPFVPEVVRYKLPGSTAYPYQVKSAPLKAPPAFARVLSVQPYAPRVKNRQDALRSTTRWCISTRAGNFFTSFGLVKNCRDCVTTWLTASTARKELKELPQNPALYAQDAWQEFECQRWTRTGILVDLEALAYFQHLYKGIAANALAAMKDVVRRLTQQVRDDAEDGAGPGLLEGSNLAERVTELLERLEAKADDEVLDDTGALVQLFNPSSLIQLRLMLSALGVPLTQLTPTGQLSTMKEFLTAARKELLETGAKPDDSRVAFLDYLFAWREASKIESTYLRPELLADGRVHPSFKVHVVPTGRLASAGPNWQNQPAEIRGMYVARPGHILVFGDWDAVELRLGALLSQDPTFLKDLDEYDAKRGPKVHVLNMVSVFGMEQEFAALVEQYGPVEGGAKLAKKYPECYRAAKVWAYSCAYGAGPQTVFEQVREEMPDMTWEHFKECYERYKSFRARLFEFQAEVVRNGTRDGYLETAVLKRRGYFFERVFGEDSPEASKMQNFPYQGSTADVVGLANRRVMAEVVVPLRARLRRGEALEQLAQIHDELLFEVPGRLAKRFAKRFKAVAEERVKPDWNLPVEVGTAHRWKPVQTRCACGELVTIEPVERTVDTATWGGVCKCGKEHRLKAPRVPALRNAADVDAAVLSR